MKNLLTLIAGCIVTFYGYAQQVQYNADGSFYKKCISMYKSKPLRELIAEHNAKNTNMKIAPHPAADEDAHRKHLHTALNLANVGSASIIDGARQINGDTIESNGTIVNIDGQQSLQNAYPLDPNGMIGSNYYVQTVNINYAVYDKKGKTVLATTDMVNLFTGSNDDGDPVTLYDKVADRWIITEFDNSCISCSINTLLFAISVTNDPTGSYYVYSFDPDNSNSDDYPKYVVWSDGYYCTCNCSNNDYVIVFERDSMLKGSTNAGYITIPWKDNPSKFVGNNTGPGFFCPMMLDCDGTLPPYGSPEFLFYFWDNNWGAGGNDAICIDKISVDWTAKTGTTSHYDTLLTAPFTSTFTGGTESDIAQPDNNPSDDLDALDGFFAYRIPYLRWASYNSAVMCNVVNVGDATNRVAGIRWYELHQDTATNVWSIHQQSTFAPNDRISRWNPSIAMDQNGNIGLAYTVSDSTSVYPGCRYTGRFSSDSLNKMTIQEVDAYNGNAIAHTPEGNGNRWGDYSHLSVDPVDGLTFWHTNMYTHSGYGGGDNVGTRIYSFQISKKSPDITPPPPPTAIAVTTYQNGSTLNITGANFPENQPLEVQLFDINGKKLLQEEIVTTTITFQTSLNVATLAKAIYLLRIGNNQIQRVLKIRID